MTTTRDDAPAASAAPEHTAPEHAAPEHHPCEQDGPAAARATAGRTRAALAGVVAVGVAIGTTELVSGVLQAPSLVIAVGDTVVDSVPGWLERAAISLLGTWDKPVLLASVLLVSLVIGGVVGLLAARNRHLGSAGFVLFAVLGMAAALRDPASATVPTLLVTVAGGCAGMLALNRLLISARPPRAGLDGAPLGRRRFVGTVVASLAVAGIGVVGGRLFSSREQVAAARAAVRLPAPAQPLPPVPAPPPASADGVGFDIDGLTPQYVPNEDFYRIDTALRVPQIDPAAWSMTVGGLVERPFTLTYADLLALPQTVADITLSCVSNEVGGDLVGNARWQGVLLKDLLEQAGPQADATQVVGRSVDGFTAGFPTQVALEADGAMVAVAMNGEPLPVEHGFPARLVVPGLYGYVSATKWLAEIELTRREDVDGYWIPRGWSKDGPVKTQSRIDVPAPGSRVAEGRTPVAGIAWAPTRGIEKVEVQVDDGPWREADLAPSLGVNSWRQWSMPWEASAGPHRLTVRATDSTGETQTERRTQVAPDGASGHHTVLVQVDPA